MKQQKEPRIVQFSEESIDQSIKYQIRNSLRSTNHAFFHCDGEDYMMYKGSRKNSNGDILPTFRIYRIIYNMDEPGYDDFFQHKFSFELVK